MVFQAMIATMLGASARLLILVLATASLRAAASDRRTLAAPMGLRTEGSIRQLFLDMPLLDARAPIAAFDARWSMANDWSTPTFGTSAGKTVEIRTDEQEDALTLSLRMPWSRLLGEKPPYDRISTTLEWRLVEHWGGWTDGVIEWWHRFAGFGNFYRGRYPSNEVHLTLGESGGTRTFDVQSAQFAWGDLVARTSFLLVEGGEPVVGGEGPGTKRWGISARVDLKAPTGSLSRVGGSGGFDAGVGLAGTAELTSFLVAHTMATAQYWSGFAGNQVLQPLGFHWSAEVSLVFLVGPVALFIEDRVVSAMFDNTGWTRVDDPKAGNLSSSAWFATFRAHNQVSTGIRFSRFTLWFSEDWTPGSNPGGASKWFYDSNAPDVVLGLAYTQPL